MTDFAAISDYSKSDSRKRKSRWPLYLGLGIVTNGIVWSLAIAYIKLASPSYTSEWAITLPGGRSTTRVDVPGIGGATSESDSPYRNPSQDPRENYKFIAESEEVIEEAAGQLNLTPKEFGEPRISMVDNTTMMQFEVAGETPEQARAKAIAIHSALEDRLNELRREEMQQQDRTLQASLSTSQRNLEKAQARLSAYKASANITSPEQVQNLSTNIEDLRRHYSEISAQQQLTEARLRQLSLSLGLSPEKANQAFVLRSDPMFQEYMAKYNLASAELLTFLSIYKQGHPQVIAKQKEKDEALEAAVSQAQTILQQPISLATIEQLNLSGGSGKDNSPRQTLFQELITVQAENQGLQAQAIELTQQVSDLETRLRKLSIQESQLEDLRRDVQIAEAVFTSTLTQLDMSRSNVFVSYPPIQIVRDPNLPKKATAPKKKLVLAGAVLGSLFFTSGFVSLWIRDRRIQKAKLLKELKEKERQYPEELTVTEPYTKNNAIGISNR